MITRLHRFDHRRWRPSRFARPDLRLLVLSVALALPSCRAVGVLEVADYPPTFGILPDSISLVSWNAQKGRDARLREDFHSVVREADPDLVFLQESRLEFLDAPGVGGRFAPSWRYPWPGGDSVGVTTLSRVEPERAIPLPSRWREFFITSPKLSLVSEYPLSGGETLLAVNVHCLVFERWGTMRLRSQLRDLEAVIARHDGPVIVAGDFNTWSRERLALVHAMADRLGLREVDVDGARTTGDFHNGFGNWLFGVDKEVSLDRVFQRGFVVRSAATLPYDSSDHVAIHAVLEREADLVELAGKAAELDTVEPRADAADRQRRR